MALRTKYEEDSKKLREMGLEPDKMTIRERHEALYGTVEGKSLTETAPGLKKQPQRHEITTPATKDADEGAYGANEFVETPSKTENSAFSQCRNDSYAPKSHMRGNVLHSVEQFPLPRKKARQKPRRRSPEEILAEMKAELEVTEAKRACVSTNRRPVNRSGQTQMQLF